VSRWALTGRRQPPTPSTSPSAAERHQHDRHTRGMIDQGSGGIC
jgi:hypothetical protein